VSFSQSFYLVACTRFFELVRSSLNDAINERNLS